MTLLAATTKPHAPPLITVANCSEGSEVVVAEGVVVDVPFEGVGGVRVGASGARARTMGRAKAETTMPVVKKQASSRPGLVPDEPSPHRLAMRVGIGEIK